MYSAESYEANHIINACIDECAKSYANSFWISPCIPLILQKEIFYFLGGVEGKT